MKDTEPTPSPLPVRGYAFGPFVVDAVRRRVWKDGGLLSISSRPFEVLLVLLEHPERVVAKDEFMDRVWPDAVVQENNLTRQIATLRRVLGRADDQSEYIATVQSVGYQFVALVEPLTRLPADRYAPPRRAGAASPSVPVATPRIEPGRTVAVHRRYRVTSVVAASALLLVAFAGSRLWLGTGSPASESQRTLRRVTFDEAAVPREASWAPDGQWLVYASDRSGAADLWKQHVGDPDPVRLTSSDAVDSQPAWSPDGRWIVFRSTRDGGGLFVMSADGNGVRRLSAFGHGPTWSPDGTRVLFKRSEVIADLPNNHFVVGLDGAESRQVRPDVLGRFTSLYAAWSPNSVSVSVWGTRSGDVVRQFLNVPLESGEPAAALTLPMVVARLGGLVPGPFAWAPSGRYVYFEATAHDTRNLWRVTVDPSTGTWVGGPDRLTTGTVPESELAVSPDGTRLLFTATSGRTGLWAFPFESADGAITGAPFAMSQGSAGEVDFDADTSGLRVAYRAERAGRYELWESRLSGGQDRLLSSSMQPTIRPVWSPDGAQLAFSRKTTGDELGVEVVNLDGSGERSVTEPDDGEMLVYDWSPDGHDLLGPCRAGPRDRYAVCMVAADDFGSGLRVVAADPLRNLFNPRFSPDQRWISFLAHDLSTSSSSTVLVAPSGGGPWLPVTDGDWFDDKPRWGPDGRVLYFVSNRDGRANVWGRRFDPRAGAAVGDIFQVTAFRSAQFQITPRTVPMEIAVTPRHLILPMTEARSGIWMLEGIDR